MTVEENSSKEWKMFMAHIDHEHIEYVKETLVKYLKENAQYIIAQEAHPYEHMHFLCEMTPSEYHKFSKVVFKDKFKLRGRASQGQSRQYGVMSNIRDLNKAKQYTVKDGKLVTNMDDDEIKQLIKDSYKKQETIKDLKEECVDYVVKRYVETDEMMNGWAPNNRGRDIAELVIRFLREKKKMLTQSKVKTLTYWCMCYGGNTLEVSDSEIYSHLFPNGI